MYMSCHVFVEVTSLTPKNFRHTCEIAAGVFFEVRSAHQQDPATFQTTCRLRGATRWLFGDWLGDLILYPGIFT